MEVYSLQFEINATSAVAGAKQFQNAMNGTAKSVATFEQQAKAAFDRLKGSSSGSFSKLAADMKKLSGIRIDPALASNISRLSSALSGFKAPSASQVRNTVALASALNSIRVNTSGAAGLARVMNNLANFRAPSATAARNVQQFMNALGSLRIPTGAANIALTLSRISAAASSASRNIAPLRGAMNGINFAHVSSGARSAASELRGLENAFSMSYQAGSVFRNLIGSITLGTLGKEVFDVGNDFATFRAAIKSATGSSKEAADELKFISESADSLGAPLRGAVQEYGKFAAATRAAGVSAESTHGVFTGLSLAGTVLGLDAEKMSRNFDTATQVFSKGKLSMEELRQQFGDSLPGAFQKMENALKSRGIIKAKENLSDLLAQGKISSKALLLLSADMIKEFGGQLPEAMQRPSSGLIVLGNQITRLFETINQSGFGEALSKQFRAVANIMKSNGAEEAARKIGSAVGGIINFVGDTVQILLRNASTVAQVMKVVVGYFTVRTSFGLFASAGSSILSILGPLTRVTAAFRLFGPVFVGSSLLVRGAAIATSATIAGIGIAIRGVAATSALITGIGTAFAFIRGAVVGAWTATTGFRAAVFSAATLSAIVTGIGSAFAAMRAAILASVVAVGLMRGGFAALVVQTAAIRGAVAVFAALRGAVAATTAAFTSGAIASRLFAVTSAIGGGLTAMYNGLAGALATVRTAFTASAAAAALFNAAGAIASGLIGGIVIVVGALAAAMATSMMALGEFGTAWETMVSDKYTLMEKLQGAWLTLKDYIAMAVPYVTQFGQSILSFFGVAGSETLSFGDTWRQVFEVIYSKSAEVIQFIINGIRAATATVKELFNILSLVAERAASPVTFMYKLKTDGFDAATKYIEDLNAKTSEAADKLFNDDAVGREMARTDFTQGAQEFLDSWKKSTGEASELYKKHVEEVHTANEKMKAADANQRAIEFTEMQRRLDAQRKQLEKEGATGVRLDGSGGAGDKKFQSSFKQLLQDVDPTAAATQKLREQMDILDEAFRRGEISPQQYAKYIGELRKQFDEAAGKPSKLTKELIDLRDELDPTAKAQEEFNQKLAILDANKANLGLQEHARLLDLLKEKYAGAAQGAYAFKDGVRSYVDSLGTFSDRFAKIQEDFTGKFIDNFSEMIATGKADWRGLIDDMIRQLIRLMVQQAFVKLFGGMSGGGGNFFGNLFGASSNVVSSANSATSATSSASAGTGGFLSSISSFFSSKPSAPLTSSGTLAYSSSSANRTIPVSIANVTSSSAKVFTPSPLMQNLQRMARNSAAQPKAIIPTPQMKPYLDYITKAPIPQMKPTLAAPMLQKAPLQIGGGAGQFNMVGNFVARGANKVDPQLVNILREASRTSGMKAEAYSGWRPYTGKQGGTGFHTTGKATDVRLFGANGKALPNYQNPAYFRQYEVFAQHAKMAQNKLYPGSNDLRWGGYFSGGKGKYGAMDMMHFDLGGRKRGMLGGSWEGGLTARQRQLIPGATSVGMGKNFQTKAVENISAQFQTKMQSATTNIATAMPVKFQPPMKQLGVDFGNALKPASSGLRNFSSSLSNVGTGTSITVPRVQNFGSSVSQLQGPLSQAAKGMGGLGQSLSGMFSSIAGGLGGGGGGGGGLEGILGIGMQILGSFFHTGGTVGGAARTASMPASTWSGAKRFHTGLKADEFPAILQKGEHVLTKQHGDTLAQALGMSNFGKFFEKAAGGPLDLLGGKLPGFKDGGEMRIGGSGGPDSKTAAFRVSPGETVSVKTPAQMKAEERSRNVQGSGTTRSGKESLTERQKGVNIVNVMDPTLAVAAMNSANGRKTILNTIKANPNAVRQILRA